MARKTLCFAVLMVFSRGLAEKSTQSAGYYAVGKLYEKLNRPDSALFYAERALEGTDLYVKCSANQLMYRLAIKNQKLDKAFEYNERYLLLRDSIEQIYRPQELLKIESLYNRERLVNKQKQQLNEARNRQHFFLIAFLCICLICVIIYIVYEKKFREQKLKSLEIHRQLQEIGSLLKIKDAAIKEKEHFLASVRTQLEESEKTICFYEEKINYLEEGNTFLKDEYEQKLREANEEKIMLNDEKGRILNEKTSLINQKNKLLEQKEFQISSLYAKKVNSERIVFMFKKEQKKVEHERDQLRCELETNRQELVEIRKELEQLRLQNEQQQQKSIEEMKQKCRMYEHWAQRLVQQNDYLSTLVNSRNVVLFDSKIWSRFNENFEDIYPGFIAHLSQQFSINERELKICCLVKLGLKTGKIAAIFNLSSDTITKLKAEIKEKYFTASDKQTLDRLIERMYW